jgi:hypothetical protein
MRGIAKTDVTEAHSAVVKQLERKGVEPPLVKHLIQAQNLKSPRRLNSYLNFIGETRNTLEDAPFVRLTQMLLAKHLPK